jgi:hypothetical protein
MWEKLEKWWGGWIVSSDSTDNHSNWHTNSDDPTYLIEVGSWLDRTQCVMYGGLQ